MLIKLRSQHQLTFLFILFLFAACKPSAKISVLQPAQLIIPDHIQKIILIDRSKPSGGFFSNIESIFSGEEYQQDKQGRQRALEALSQILTQTPRFQTISSGVELEGSRGGRSFMSPLSWYEVENICQQYHGDAIVSIEMFDSNIDATAVARTIKEKDKNDKEISKVVYDGKKNGTVNLGWRFYDPKNKMIVDEYSDSDHDEATTNGAVSNKDAINNLKRSYELVRGISTKLGEKYGKRIAPVYVTMSRTYYKTIKGVNKDRFEQAARYADAGEWIKAVPIWEKIAGTKSDPESAGKATYNLAVAYEVNGQLNIALQFAKDAYTQFNNKSAKSYIRTLEARLDDQEVLSRQMHEVKKT
ncbi:MAG: DUF6340 family protein, partial [Saprospiraceae bacterium]